MTEFSALNTAVTGLHAHKRRIDVIGENLANVETPGYHRQVTRLSSIDTRKPGVFSGPGGQHGGVTTDVDRRWNQLLDDNAKRSLVRTNSIEAQAAAMSDIEAELGTLAEGGLSDRLQRLWNSFDDLANAPEDLGIRNVVLGNAGAVAAEFNGQADSIMRQRTAQIASMEVDVARINELSVQIADLDRTIAGGTAVGNPPHGAMDERDRLATELVGLTGATVTYDDLARSRITVDGYELVGDGRSRSVALQTVADPALNDVGYPKLVLMASSGRQIRLIGGTVHGGLQVVNNLLTSELRKMNELADLTVTTVNAIHQTGTGLDGSTGSSLFDPASITAATLAVSADVAGRPERLAASDGSGPLDNSVALSLAALGEDPAGPSAAHADYVAGLAGRVRALSDQAEVAGLVSTHAENARQAAAGVNMDEELADLVSAQRAFEASSRMISTVDQMLDTLINRTGLVGR